MRATRKVETRGPDARCAQRAHLRGEATDETMEREGCRVHSTTMAVPEWLRDWPGHPASSKVRC